MQSAFEHVR